MRSRKIALLVVGLAFLMVSPAAAEFTTIANASSGQEIDLWQALNHVTVGYDWTSTGFLNNGAGGRRVHDRLSPGVFACDQIWQDGVIRVSTTALFWGGGAEPMDTNYQDFRYDK